MPLGSKISIEVAYRTDTAVGAKYWVNRYEADAGVGGLLTDATLVADAFKTALLPLLIPVFTLDHIVLSTYAPDSKPYNPDNLVVVPYSLRGTRDPATVPMVLPLSNVLHIRKLCANGRLGHIFLRGYLAERDIQSDGNGGVALSYPSDVQTEVSAAFAAMQAGLGSGVTLSMVSGTGMSIVTRPVTGFRVAGLTNRSLRTARKTRVVQNALSAMSSILADGTLALGEVPQFVLSVAEVAKALGHSLPPLLP